MWQATFATDIGAQQAFLGGKRYTTHRSMNGDGRYVASDGRWREYHDSREEAERACERRAGTTTYDPIPAYWDCSGASPGKCVG